MKQKSTTRNGAVETSKPPQAVISLPLRNQDALNTLLADLYNPASASYHHWLQPADFDARFGPTAVDYAALVSWARSNGAKNDTLTVAVINAAGATTTIASFSNLDHSTGYVLHSYDLSAFIGQTVTLKFTGVENRSKLTAFILDDISVITQ